jgi:hypothetical protein
MRQIVEIRRLPLCEAPSATWLSRLRARLFGPGGRPRTFPLQHCSAHLMRDLGLLDDRRANHLLRDEVLFRR